MGAADGSLFSPAISRLPPGFAGLPRDLITASQRQRLLHGVTESVARKGYPATTVTDITSSAGVSKKTLYEHFPDKLACFLAAYDLGCEALLDSVTATARSDQRAGVPPRDALRNALRAYLDFLVAEPVYARTYFIEVLAAGPEALARRRHWQDRFMGTIRRWHERARAANPNWPEVPDHAYRAVTGATHELVMGEVALGRGGELRRLENELLYAYGALMRVPAG